MLCFQCEQTQKGTGCTVKGVCSKTPEVAAIQDLLLLASSGLAYVAKKLPADYEQEQKEATALVTQALFSTVTNVNFDADVLCASLYKLADLRDRLKGKLPENIDLPLAATLHFSQDREALIKQGELYGIESREKTLGKDITGLQELLTYGIKGMAAYAHHAAVLDFHDNDVDAFILEGMAALTDHSLGADALLALVMRCGEASYKTLGLLDKANTSSFGHPEPTAVKMGPSQGKAILVSGHDLLDIKALLEQTANTGIKIYTHGEMLPAHSYPELKKYPHLAGHYGGAWMRQRQEFINFPGPIVMTTNCLMEPRSEYAGRVFTRDLVGWPGLSHLPDRDFSKVIEAAQAMDGFTEDDKDIRLHNTGFGHNTVLNAADAVISAVKKGDIKHFMLVGGCDGAKLGRNYFTDIAEKAPKDWIILTLGCGKFRLTDLDLGEIGGLPRLLDMGQCNDSYSAIKVALALAEAFETDVNSLPLSLILSWYEQKAVCVLLALLYLGVKGIRIGPSLPAFITPNMLKILVDNFDIKAIGTSAESDLQAIITAKAA
ncbi:MAG: hydroxylamine reductase [Zymomonas mobilis subsp. pomaceae]|uniref:Hydroxylamine reductase n=1 Tax=Zymomonas mobilis subsp. pomaceae (strain ATCC 29192 / DSM 22645 / JCM 10191 / CCUG 17912 / NBRC 13757 / NCIMB 11200 / NRRL B-4491 / Barker I) TaxID=579138 RepID=F8ETT4_ZYMMT|nr:hydroxylamine reductase [Zymomonas mobilis]AEI38031.1 hybrid cluster protein [Zymomonas mobilis subsp. pomaceae ATCC 29192]MDX5949398.1 hydroxylamine reductase [Zymomonas mobilis subsp. pomaceae]GEB89141.1 hydroxylamine reductase [Zymomonas mobilis subsp. pomaceae]